MDKLNFENPSYNRDTGKAVWSRLYFGNYPQTEVKDSGLIPGIVQAGYNEDGDACVDGIKYRRIKQGSTFRYFRWDKIQWRVLWNDGNTLFVISDKGLDCKEYNNTDEVVTWEHSSLREWLANNFYNMAFSSREQEAILTHEVENNTSDKIYLPSVKELRTSVYGFWDEKVYWEHKIDKKINRRMKPTSYAEACGVWVCGCTKEIWYKIRPDNSYDGNCCWWTRSPCGYTKYSNREIKYNAKVTESGSIYKYEFGYALHGSQNAVAVVPVMNLDIEKLTDIIKQ